jgi:hypothetical protein
MYEGKSGFLLGPSGGVNFEAGRSSEHLHRDRILTYPTLLSISGRTYTVTINGKTTVSASIVDLIKQGAPAEVDFSALNVFLRSGFYVGTNTILRSI